MSGIDVALFEAIADINQEFSALIDLQSRLGEAYKEDSRGIGGLDTGRRVEEEISTQEELCKSKLATLVPRLRSVAWKSTLEHHGHLLDLGEYKLTADDANRIMRQLLLFLGQATEAQVKHLAYLEDWQRRQDSNAVSMF